LGAEVDDEDGVERRRPGSGQLPYRPMPTLCDR
jgi:hypothetical protein